MVGSYICEIKRVNKIHQVSKDRERGLVHTAKKQNMQACLTETVEGVPGGTRTVEVRAYAERSEGQPHLCRRNRSRRAKFANLTGLLIFTLLLIIIKKIHHSVVWWIFCIIIYN